LLVSDVVDQVKSVPLTIFLICYGNFPPDFTNKI